jgi:hypothetical protein
MATTTNATEEMESCRKELRRLKRLALQLDKLSDSLVKRIGAMSADDVTSNLYEDAVEFHLEVSGWNATMKRGESAEED